MLAGALKPEGVCGVFGITDIRMPVADTAAADADVLDTVIVPAGDRGVPQRLAHEVAQQRVGAQEAQADVGGFGEVTQQRRVGEVHSTWAPVHQGHHDLAVLQRHNPGVLGAADDIVVLRDALQRPQPEPFQAVPLGGCKVLPGLVGVAKVCGLLQHPEVWPRGIGKLDEHVGHVENLAQVQGDVDLVVL